MDVSSINSVNLSIIANIIYQILFWGVSAIYNKTKNGFSAAPLSISSTFIVTLFTPLFISISWLLYFLTIIDLVVASSVTVYILLVAFFVLSIEIWRFRKVGIVGLDVQISKGVDYKKALKLTKRNLKLLGTGADKLTQQVDEFEEAISSASRQNRAKLLLCNPNNKALQEMAISDKKPPNEYVNNVKTSLGRLKQIHLETEKFEIRFYEAEVSEDMPIFRLMFFNDHYCLCSFNSFGNKDKGKSAPQLHLRCPTNDNGKLLYYRAFENYFDDLWKKSKGNRIFDKVDWDKFGL